MAHVDNTDNTPPGQADHNSRPPWAVSGTSTRSAPGVQPDVRQQSPVLGPDATVRDLTRAARAAFVSTDLLQSGPPLWPFGRRAAARRDRNRRAAAEARRRRDQFRAAFDAGRTPSGPRLARWRPVDRRTNVVVIAGLAVVVLAVLAVAMWPTPADPQPGGQHRASPPASAGASSTPVVSRLAPQPTTDQGTGLPGPPPIPSGGVAPITPRPNTVVDPGSVQLVDPPSGDPTATELSTPDGAMRAWLARWCPFDYRYPFGTAEGRARTAMTDVGWSTVNPSVDERARASWARTVAAREAGRCAQPVAQVSPEAPRAPTSAIVIGSIERVVTAQGQPPYVEHHSEVRIVRLGADGLWRVDLPTTGG